jgi:hypothetical protein
MDMNLPLLTFAVQFGAILGVVTPVGCVVQRIWDGRWVPTRHMWLGMSAAAAVLSLVSTIVLGLALFS